jgi:hypothetical protein
MASVATAATSSTVSAPFKLQTKLPVNPSPRVTLSSVTANNVCVGPLARAPAAARAGHRTSLRLMLSHASLNSGTLRKLNEATFPVHYSDKVRPGLLERACSPSGLTCRSGPVRTLQYYEDVLDETMEDFNKLGRSYDNHRD